MKLSAKTKIDELLKEHKFLEDFLVEHNSKFEMLKNKIARATLGKVANLKAVASIGGMSLSKLMRDVADEVERVTGVRPDVDSADGEETGDRQGRLDALKEVILALHDGASVEEVRSRFKEAVDGAEAGEIAEMEQQLIRGGMPVEEVQRLCDVHVGAFRDTLDKSSDAKTPPGHPVHTYMKENERIADLANELGRLARSIGTGADEAKLKEVVEALGGLGNHYVRKENQLFPFLEKHGISGPSKVMWGIHDEIRSSYKAVKSKVDAHDLEGLAEPAAKLARDVAEMIYKENKILFPMTLQHLDESEWVEVRRGEDALGYAFDGPEAEWPGDAVDNGPSGSLGDEVVFPTGRLGKEQLELIMNRLPVDISFVDENDEVRYYSGGERHFPRSPAVIGRKVQNCHPPASVDTVQKILDAFRSGEKDVAEFWLDLHGKRLHIRYFAVRDANGGYRGCLEVGQDITEIQKLTGERRLLEWDK